MTMEVIAEIKNQVGWITLNRPKALNALSYEMVSQIERILLEWKYDKDVALICLEGAGEKAFCAGGDIRTLYDRRDQGLEEFASSYFQTEYRMDHMIYHYPKPILAWMDGYVMGGGVGISYGASHRIITERTRWAMPEMTIGFFPDVGASYFLNQMPRAYGRYLALTADTITAADVLLIGAADYYIPQAKLAKLKDEIEHADWLSSHPKTLLETILQRYNEACHDASNLKQIETQIQKHFSLDTIEEILNSLRHSAEHNDDHWAANKWKSLQEKSPTSLKVALEQVNRAQHLSLAQCFQMEWNLALNFMKNHDFHEGVRALLVDKDRQPRWKPATLSEVTEELVSSYFNDPCGAEKHPLKDLKN